MLPDEVVIWKGRIRKVASALRGLPGLEGPVLARRLLGWTLTEVAQKLGRSRERIRQIETRAVRRLRKLCQEWQ